MRNLKTQSYRKLKGPAPSDSIDSRATANGACHLPEGCARDRTLWAVELRRIAQLEGVDAGFKRETFPDREGLEE